MRLMRNADGRGKYTVIDNRTGKSVEDSGPGGRNEFFVLMLKDRYARTPLLTYADSVFPDDPEYARDVIELADRAGPRSPYCKDPD